MGGRGRRRCDTGMWAACKLLLLWPLGHDEWMSVCPLLLVAMGREAKGVPLLGAVPPLGGSGHAGGNPVCGCVRACV